MSDAAAPDPEPTPAPAAASATAPAAEPELTPTPEPEAAAPPTSRPRSFAAWRGERPFWGGLLITLSGAEILFTEKAPLPVVLHIGMLGLAGYLVPAILLLCGLLILFNPAQRLFYSILSVVLTLGTWITSNLGGFILGLLLGLIGSVLAFGWLPAQPSRRELRARRSTPAPGEPPLTSTTATTTP